MGEGTIKYKVRRMGIDLGTFTVEELLLRLEMGFLKGDEEVRTEEMTQWIPLTEAMTQHQKRRA